MCLKNFMQLISQKLEATEKHSLALAFIDFKKDITGGTFGTLSRTPISPSNQLYFDIDASYNELYIELEESYLIWKYTFKPI